MNGAATLVAACQVYAWIGVLVCLAFVGFGIDRVDENARGSYLFRVLLVPGSMLLWPLVAIRWLQLTRGDTPSTHWRTRHTPRRRLHARTWAVLAALIPLLVLVAFMARQQGPVERPAEQLSPPPENAAWHDKAELEDKS